MTRCIMFDDDAVCGSPEPNGLAFAPKGLVNGPDGMTAFVAGLGADVLVAEEAAARSSARSEANREVKWSAQNWRISEGLDLRMSRSRAFISFW